MASRTTLADLSALKAIDYRRDRRNRRIGQIIQQVIVYALLIGLSLLFLFPLFWMFTTALKTNAQIYIWPPQWLPDPIQWSNFPAALNDPYLPFSRFFINTLIVEAGVVSGRLVSCTLVAYGFARLNAPGKNVLFTIMLATLMLPSVAVLIPQYVLFTRFGWIGSFLPLIVPAWFGEAFAIFLIRQFFMTIPYELEEAALIDGANRLTILWRIIIPLSMPVLAVIVIFTFKDNWNDFLRPLLFLSNSKLYTVAIGIQYYNGQNTVQMNLLMAASVAMLIPVIGLFIVAQRAFVEGISLTGIKG
jgi:multiple sugar transport system permease protein